MGKPRKPMVGRRWRVSPITGQVYWWQSKRTPELRPCPRCGSRAMQGLHHVSVCDANRRAGRVKAKPVTGPLPEPLRWYDLCECGQERKEHSGAHGWGGCLANECPSFKEAK